jgi:hypothetical protein
VRDYTKINIDGHSVSPRGRHYGEHHQPGDWEMWRSHELVTPADAHLASLRVEG